MSFFSPSSRGRKKGSSSKDSTGASGWCVMLVPQLLSDSVREEIKMIR